ncbi:MAG: Re/Si-specific NAD(P)(+) transhydrogenase subunit alpha [Alphaproteobacteria bacterium]|nr:Re/Si-specific NAD(P)(+) transhydrogenase subunit alpha [Alphaproteobacteria bacterium]
MRLAVPKEIRAGEGRIAASPDMIKKLTGRGITVVVEAGAGAASKTTDAMLSAAGAEIATDAAATYADADIVCKVQRPMTAAEGTDEIALMKPGALLVGYLSPLQHRDDIRRYAERGLITFAMELIPRISRAQSMDALSSQSNLAGYKAVVEAAALSQKVLPLMMTAAGTVAPARVLVLGAGVAGLQAIATARRLGAVVAAFDVRRAAKEQVESLGAAFVEVPPDAGEEMEAASGYARETSTAYQERQAAKIHELALKSDIIITSALIPGKPAPMLIQEATIHAMKSGAVIVDLAAEAGGNTALTRAGDTVVCNGVTILGQTDLTSRSGVDASQLYARNLLSFLLLILAPESAALAIDWNDEIVKGALLTRDGAVVNPLLTS